MYYISKKAEISRDYTYIVLPKVMQPAAVCIHSATVVGTEDTRVGATP